MRWTAIPGSVAAGPLSECVRLLPPLRSLGNETAWRDGRIEDTADNARDVIEADRSAQVMTSSASAISIVSAGAFCRLDSTMNGSETAEMPAESRYDGP